ncbi:hypothetical protein VTH82DRAFT_7087 [Thermothelomyces myriococcoides]
MPQVNGIFSFKDPHRVTAIFVVDEIRHIFNANVSPPLERFTSSPAMLTYDDPTQLTSSHPCSGVIGTNMFLLNLDNGPKIVGNLNDPGLSAASNVDGIGAWEQV